MFKPYLMGRPGWVKPGASFDSDFASGRYFNQGGANGLADFLSTTRASSGYAQTSSGLLIPFASNVPRITDQGLLVEEARTNVVLWNRDLTNAAWTASNVTVAKDQIGADGVAASASSLTATSANGTVLQAITLGSSARFQSAYVKRLTGTGTINMTMDNGATWTAIVPTASWTKLTVPTQTLANPTVGFRIVTSGDAIAVDFVQNENGAFATSPILTTTASATRAADVITLTGAALAAIQGANGWVLAQTNTLVNGTGTYSPYIVAGGNVNNNTFVRVNTATTSYSKFAGTVLNSTLGSGAYNTGRVKTGVTWSAAGRSLAANNGTVATDANAPTSPTTVYLGSANGTVPSNGLIERITIGTSRLADATIKALSA